MAYRAVKFKIDEVNAIVGNIKSEFRIPVDYHRMDTEMITPPYSAGEILYVKEIWAKYLGEYWYKADLVGDELREISHRINSIKWCPVTCMPHEAARIFLEITNIKCQYLQDITLDEIEREGIWLPGVLFPKDVFASCWDQSMSETKQRSYGWNANPKVWVFGFRLCEKPKDFDCYK